MFSATATATATATTTTPSLLKQFWTQCKGLLSVFSPCGSSALSEEPSVGLDVVAAASTETPLEIQQSGELHSEPNNMHTACMPRQIPAYDNPRSHCWLKEIDQDGLWCAGGTTNGDLQPFPKDVCVDWFKCTNITLTGVCTQPTLYMLARLSDGTIQIEYNDGDEDSDYPVLSIDYHSSRLLRYSSVAGGGQKSCGCTM
ncbi:hypothetical protein BASA62_002017 [Batrachochytrium salamandrivorans]|nr:hypothetical protein BASA62_002017 [Batrachochytrium salamandrivorans]